MFNKEINNKPLDTHSHPVGSVYGFTDTERLPGIVCSLCLPMLSTNI